METAIADLGYIGIMEKKTETNLITIVTITTYLLLLFLQL